MVFLTIREIAKDLEKDHVGVKRLLERNGIKVSSRRVDRAGGQTCNVVEGSELMRAMSFIVRHYNLILTESGQHRLHCIRDNCTSINDRIFKKKEIA